MIFPNIANFAWYGATKYTKPTPVCIVSIPPLVYPIDADERTKLDFRRNQTEVLALHAARVLKFTARMHSRDTLTRILIVHNFLVHRCSPREGLSFFVALPIWF